MKVFVTQWVCSGRVDYVDLQPTDDGKYLHGRDNGFDYFVGAKAAHKTVEDAKKDTVARFRKRQDSLKTQLNSLYYTEKVVLGLIETMGRQPPSTHEDKVSGGKGGVE